MLRIEEEQRGERRALRLEGRVVGPWIETLRAACDRLLARDDTVVLDLAGVDFIDRDARQFLCDLRGRGARFVRVSPFLAELLKEKA